MIIAGVFAVIPLYSQNSGLQFEVASLKPSAADARPGTVRPLPGRRRYAANAVPLKLLITVAYRVNGDQVTGGPGWISTDRFDMNAEAEKPSSIEQLHVMLRNLLAERFKLRMHSETKERPVYVLSVDRSGVKMTPRDAATAGDPLIAQPAPGTLTAQFTPMDYFAWLLSLFLDRPVLDRTGLKGVYDFRLSWTPVLSAGLPDSRSFNDAADDNSGPGIFEAVRKQTGPVEILVMDHAEKPGPD
jgi:uncharacterized protein (TIGR03435 family)